MENVIYLGEKKPHLERAIFCVVLENRKKLFYPGNMIVNINQVEKEPFWGFC